MGNYTMFGTFENPRRGMQARNLTKIVPKILDLKSSSEQIFSKNCRWVPLRRGGKGATQGDRKGCYFYSPQSSTVIKSKMAATTIRT